MECNGSAVKQYREGNITASFGTDLFMQGGTFVPNILLKWYRQIGLNESEMMLLLHLLRLRIEEKELLPSTATMGSLMSGGQAQAEESLQSLLDKNIITVTQYFHEVDQIVVKGYDFEPLFEKISEAWARKKVNEIEKTQKYLEEDLISEMSDKDMGELYSEFENEFGRPLSPIEAEQVMQWHSDLGPVLVREALRRAVLLGKHNFKYIDSILLEWHKNNIRTLQQVQEFEKQFQMRRNRRQPKPQEKNNVAFTAQDRDRERQRALIKSLYIS